jgi:hypothetical protein
MDPAAKRAPAFHLSNEVVMDGAFSSDDCELFAKALEHAWEIFLKAGRLTPQNHDIAKAVLAQAILDAGKIGNQNARQLGMKAAASFDKYEGIVRHRRAWHAPNIGTAAQGHG